MASQKSAPTKRQSGKPGPPNAGQQPTPADTETPGGAPTPEEIAICAYAIWEREGRPEGCDTEH